MNKVILMGRLTRDPEIRYSNGSPPVAMASYTLAVDRAYKKEGQQNTDFINCAALGKNAEFVEKYLKKGHKMVVCGRLQVRNYEDNNGQKRSWTEVLVEDHQFAESKQTHDQRMDTYRPEAVNGSDQGYGAEPTGFMPIEEAVDDDDLPF